MIILIKKSGQSRDTYEFPVGHCSGTVRALFGHCSGTVRALFEHGSGTARAVSVREAALLIRKWCLRVQQPRSMSHPLGDGRVQSGLVPFNLGDTADDDHGTQLMDKILHRFRPSLLQVPGGTRSILPRLSPA